ncbi:MAG: hypothetical protein NTW83_10860 [Cyanobacteria bacterium]|nr:hypothetical protein [Cyanobacteriota bacterium]
MKPHLPDPGCKSRMPRQVFSRQRRGGAPWREGGISLLNGAAGLGVLLLQGLERLVWSVVLIRPPDRPER